jgi:hypothetical protein
MEALIDGDFADEYGHEHMNPLAAGAAYALYRHGQDHQTARRTNGRRTARWDGISAPATVEPGLSEVQPH